MKKQVVEDNIKKYSIKNLARKPTKIGSKSIKPTKKLHLKKFQL